MIIYMYCSNHYIYVLDSTSCKYHANIYVSSFQYLIKPPFTMPSLRIAYRGLEDIQVKPWTSTSDGQKWRDTQPHNKQNKSSSQEYQMFRRTDPVCISCRIMYLCLLSSNSCLAFHMQAGWASSGKWNLCGCLKNNIQFFMCKTRHVSLETNDTNPVVFLDF